MKNTTINWTVTLEKLENDIWDTPDSESNLTKECYRLRKIPLGDFNIEDLRLMLGQGIGVKHLIPLALEKLEKKPWAEGDFYEGDLLMCVLKIDHLFWSSHPTFLARLTDIISILSFRVENQQQRKMLEEKIIPAWKQIFCAE